MIRTIVFVICIFPFFCYAQDGIDRRMLKNDRIEQLINSRIIGVLNLDEETSLRFFARRSSHRNKMKELSSKKDSILITLNKKLKGEEGSYFSTVQASLNIETEIVKERNSYVNGLYEILSDEQVATLIVFERKLRKEVKNLIMDKRKMRNMKKNMGKERF